MGENTKCPIWGEKCPGDPGRKIDRDSVAFPAPAQERDFCGETGDAYLCARSGGKYSIASDVAGRVADLDEDAKIRLCGWIARQNLTYGVVPTVDDRAVALALSEAAPTVPERMMLALEWFVRNSDIVNRELPVHPQRGGLDWEKTQSALSAFTLSRDDDDGIVGLLAEEDLLVCSAFGCRVTAKGYARYEELRKSVDSSNAFVAMWFDDSMAPLREAIEAAVRAAGYEPKRVDTDPEVVGRIEDEIIALIRQSRFVVADFTASPRPIASAEDANPRGGVYYEAGFAHGLGRPVFFTCRRDYIDTPKALHFDTSHFLHIDWSEGDLGEGGKFREELRKRIEAVVGKGPKADGD